MQYRETDLEFIKRANVPASANASATATAATAKETPRVKVQFPWLPRVDISAWMTWLGNVIHNIFTNKWDGTED